MEDKIATEQLILQSAENEFMQKGFVGARTTGIAAAAGVTHAMLHYYFRTKEALFAKVIEQKFTILSRILVEILQRDDMDIVTKLESVVTAHFRFLVDNPRLPVVLMSEAKSDSNNSPFGLMGAMYSTITKYCREQLQVAIEEGRIRPVKLEDLLVDIIGLDIMSVVLAEPFAAFMHMSKEEYLQSRLEENITTLRYRIML